MRDNNIPDDRLLDDVQREAFGYFRAEVNPENGLVTDASRAGAPCSIAAVGMALAGYPVAVERGFISRREALAHTLAALRFFRDAPQSEARDATGLRGFYYHFIDMKSGERVWRSELSSIDSALLVAGMLTAAMYFDRDTAAEREAREVAEELYRRVDWRWMQAESGALRQGWRPEGGFLRYEWRGYSEALILYLLGLGSPTHQLPARSYEAWLATYRWKKIYGVEYLYAGPLFIHQLSHLWVDFRGIRDAFMRGKGIDYFENSHRATHVQREYAMRNPRGLEGYCHCCWGITACDGPGPATLRCGGRKRRFYGYMARGVPYGPDDGTVAPWCAVASLPFCPEIVLPALHYFHQLNLGPKADYGFEATFNPTFPSRAGSEYGWVSPDRLGINQGPLVMMIENYRSGLVWELMKRFKPLVEGLRRAGFRGGWLG